MIPELTGGLITGEVIMILYKRSIHQRVFEAKMGHGS